MQFDKNILKIDVPAEVNRICDFIREQTGLFKRDGALVGLSGGVDSAVASSLCVKALGKENVLGVLLPEKDSSSISEDYALRQADRLGMRTKTFNITPALEGLETYRTRDSYIKATIPEYTPECKAIITLPADLLVRDAYNVYNLTIDDGKGNVKSARLGKESFRGIIAATNTKQRMRMVQLYYYAEINNYLVCGTTNRSEDVQGFFVRYGDGGVDIEPIAHLYKTQVYYLAEYLGVTREIIERTPTPDTFNGVHSDEDFYFRIPYAKLDPLLYAWENNVPVQEVCEAMSLSEAQVKRAFRDFNAKANATKYLHSMPPAPVAASQLNVLQEVPVN